MTCSILLLLLLLAVPSVAPAVTIGTIVIAQGVDPTTLDMMNQQETPASNVGVQIFDTLLERDHDLRLVPALATELPRLVSPTVWEIKLRRGVKFHNGEDFNAESVKFSLERVANPANKLRGSANFALLERVEIVDPYTVRIHTRAPWPILKSALAFRQASLYPPRAYAGKDTTFISRNPIGTGAFRLVRWSKDEEIVLAANPGAGGARPR